MAGLLILDANGNVVGSTKDYTPPAGTVLDLSNQLPIANGNGGVGSSVGTGSASNTVSQGAGATTNFSLQSFEALILSDIANVLTSPLVGWGIILLIVWFAWKHFHKRR